MLPVRTSLSALLTNGVMIGALAIAAARHGLLLDGPAVWTVDAGILYGAKAGCLYLIAFLILHLVAQRMSLGLRPLYAAFGAVAVVATMLVMASHDQIQVFIDKGFLLLALGVLAAFGGIAGFLYHVRADYCAEGDDPHTLDGFLRSLSPASSDDGQDGHAATASTRGAPAYNGKASEDRAHVQTESAEYFDGPLQVRTSFGTMIIAALAGTLFFNFGVVFMGFASYLVQQTAPAAAGGRDIADAVRSFHPFVGVTGLDSIVGVFANSAAGALLFGVLLAIPFAGVIYVCHMVARALNQTSYLAYAGIGLVAPPVLGMLLFFVFFFVGIKMAVPCAIAMVIYRSYAGLEPKFVAEDIHVNDRRNLVGASHARRKYGRVIASR